MVLSCSLVVKCFATLRLCTLSTCFRAFARITSVYRFREHEMNVIKAKRTDEILRNLLLMGLLKCSLFMQFQNIYEKKNQKKQNNIAHIYIVILQVQSTSNRQTNTSNDRTKFPTKKPLFSLPIYSTHTSPPISCQTIEQTHSLAVSPSRIFTDLYIFPTQTTQTLVKPNKTTHLFIYK